MTPLLCTEAATAYVLNFHLSAKMYGVMTEAVSAVPEADGKRRRPSPAERNFHLLAYNPNLHRQMNWKYILHRSLSDL